MRGLVLSGGGSRGSYIVGCLKALVENGHKWDIISGVSVGALNASFLAMYKKEEQEQAIKDLEKVWLEHINSNEAVYKPWAPGFLTFICSIWKKSFYNTEPLENILNKYWNHDKIKNSNVKLVIGACSLNTGNYVSVGGTNENLLKYVRGSASYPLAFEPIEIDDDLFADGGVKDNAPIRDAILLGATEIDLILTKPVNCTKISIHHSKLKSIFHLGARFANVLSSEADLIHLQEICKSYNVKLNIYAPIEPLISKENRIESLQFKKEEIVQMIKMGYDETKSKLF